MKHEFYQNNSHVFVSVKANTEDYANAEILYRSKEVVLYFPNINETQTLTLAHPCDASNSEFKQGKMKIELKIKKM